MARAHPTVSLALMGAPTERTRHPGIFKRGSRYVVIFRFEGRQRKRSARTLREAREIQAAHRADIARGEFHPESRMRFADYAAEWIDRYTGRRGSLRDSTRSDYRSALERFVVPYLGSRTLSQITPREVAAFVRWLGSEREQGKQFSPATIQNIVKPLRACLRTAVEEGLLRTNPARDVQLPRPEHIQDEDDEEVRPLSREQLAQLLLVIDPRHRLFIKFLASTGLRISEGVAVQWRHLTLDGSGPHVRVRRALVRGREQPPKTKYGRRDVPLSTALVSDLRSQHKLTEWPGGKDPVFPSRVGTSLNPSNLRRRVLGPAMEEIDASWASFHTLRHTCASLLFSRGANAVQVQRWLGHHSAAFTLARYIHLLKGEEHAPLDIAAEVRGGNAVATQPTRVPDTPEGLLNVDAAS